MGKRSLADLCEEMRSVARGDRSAPEIPHRLVIVEWEDSAQPVSAWQWVETYQVPDTVRCVSVGFLIADIHDAIALAPNIGDVGKEQLQASGIIRIPKGAVRQMRDAVSSFESDCSGDPIGSLVVSNEIIRTAVENYSQLPGAQLTKKRKGRAGDV